MGKLTSIYLTPEEDAALRAYCDKHGCTPHSVIKAGLHWMLDEIQKQKTVEPAEIKKVQEAKLGETKKRPSSIQQLAKLLREEKE